MFGSKKGGSKNSVRHQQAVVELALKPIKKMLEEMQMDGIDVTKIKLKRFQKTHHVNCRCAACQEAKKQRNPKLRGLLEDGFKVYVEGDGKEQ